MNAQTETDNESGRGAGRSAAAVLRLFLILSVGTIYVLTMAPDVMTDDSAEFQVLCFRVQPTHPPGYPLLLMLGKVFTQLPFSTVAWRLTLMSVVFAIAAVMFLYETLLLLIESPWVAFATSVVFALSHTFWMESLLPEAYSLNACFNLALLYLLARFEHRPSERSAIFCVAAFLVAFGAGNHQVIVLMSPFYVLWLWRRGGPGFLTAGRWAAAAAAFILGASIYLVLTMRMKTFWGSVDLALGGPSRGLLFAFTPVEVLKRFLMFLGYHAYQFPLIAGLVGIGGWIWALRRRWTWWWLTMALWVVTVAYALNFDSSDVYVFYIPAYIAFAIWIGFGFDAFLRAMGGRSASVTLLMIVAIALPFPFYWQMYTAMEQWGKRTITRDKGLRYYLYPPKMDADWFGLRMRHLMRTAAQDSALLTDWNYYFTARYLQDVEGFRRDVTIRDVTRSGPEDTRHIDTIEQLAANGVEHFFSPDESLAPVAKPGWTRASHTVGWYVGPNPQVYLADARRRLANAAFRQTFPNVWDTMDPASIRSRPGWFDQVIDVTFSPDNVRECRRRAAPVHFVAEADRLVRGQGVWIAIENVRDLFPCDGWMSTGTVARERTLEGKEIAMGLRFRPVRQTSEEFFASRPLHGGKGRFKTEMTRFRYSSENDGMMGLPPLPGQPFFAGNTFYQYVIAPSEIDPGLYNVNLALGLWAPTGSEGQVIHWIRTRRGVGHLKIER